jgi:predicted RNA-binding protein associated with RNAse of E/G family
MIAEAGAAHSVYVTWGKDGELVGWYVNLEEPWRESPFGFDTTDHLLDVWIDPDRGWRWKDEDELAEAVELGLFTPAKADAIRAEGERAIERIEAWSTPFDEGWETWRPDPDWPLPELPDSWDAL